MSVISFQCEGICKYFFSGKWSQGGKIVDKISQIVTLLCLIHCFTEIQLSIAKLCVQVKVSLPMELYDHPYSPILAFVF